MRWQKVMSRGHLVHPLILALLLQLFALASKEIKDCWLGKIIQGKSSIFTKQAPSIFM